jgi:hypothetical protein
MNTETQYFIIGSLSTTCILFLFYIFIMYVLKRRKRSVLNCLYRLIYSRIESKEIVNSLCAEFRKYLTLEEADLIESHFTINKPSVKLHPKFYVNRFYCGRLYWWQHRCKESTRQRKLFILEMIKITN